MTMAPGVLRSEDSPMEDANANAKANANGNGTEVRAVEARATAAAAAAASALENAQDTLTLLRSMPEPPVECQVCVVGAGPAGLMLGANLTRCGVNVEVVDDRADQTPVGRYASPLLRHGLLVNRRARWPTQLHY